MKLNKENIKLGLAIELANNNITLDDLEQELAKQASEKTGGLGLGALLSALIASGKVGLTTATLGAAGLGGLGGMAGYGAYKAVTDSDDKINSAKRKGMDIDNAVKELQASKAEQHNY